jgi:hypothetical protein
MKTTKTDETFNKILSLDFNDPMLINDNGYVRPPVPGEQLIEIDGACYPAVLIAWVAMRGVSARRLHGRAEERRPRRPALGQS